MSVCFSFFIVALLFSPLVSAQFVPSKIDVDKCKRVCRSETDTISWQPSTQRPTSPVPNDGKWEDGTGRDKALDDITRVIICVYEYDDPSKVAPPVSPTDPGQPYQNQRCEDACQRQLDRLNGMTPQAVCAECKGSHHYYMIPWDGTPGGGRTPGTSVPKEYTPDKKGVPRPKWDQDPDTRRREYKYGWDTKTKSWIETVVPKISDWPKNKCDSVVVPQ